jgi:hypothetical protein
MFVLIIITREKLKKKSYLKEIIINLQDSKKRGIVLSSFLFLWSRGLNKTSDGQECPFINTELLNRTWDIRLRETRVFHHS